MIMPGGIIPGAPECGTTSPSEIYLGYLSCADNLQMLLLLTEDSSENVSESLNKAPDFLEVSGDLGHWSNGGLTARWSRP